MDLGGDRCKGKIHCRKPKVRTTKTFHWLSCGSLPLAELFPGKDESLPLAVEVVKQNDFVFEI